MPLFNWKYSSKMKEVKKRTLFYVGTRKNRRVSTAGLVSITSVLTILKFPSKAVLRSVRSLKAESPMGG